MEIADYLNIFNTLMCQFTNIGVKNQEEDKKVMILSSLLEY